MNAARTFLVRQVPRGTAPLRTSVGRTMVAPPAAAAVCNSRTAAIACVYNRSFAAAAAQQKAVEDVCVQTQENVNMVRDAICRMLEKNEAEAKPISNKELEQILAKFANRFEEAHACIDDCEEAKAGSLEFYEELYAAQNAVDSAFNCYVDLLDDFRRASDDQIKRLCQDRLALARSLKELRQEVQQLAAQVETQLKMKQNAV